MKDINLLVWLTQLGLSVAVPPVLMIFIARWLRDDLGWGEWVIWIGIALGIVMGIDGLRTSLKAMARLSASKKEDVQPPVSFNDHT